MTWERPISSFFMSVILKLCLHMSSIMGTSELRDSLWCHIINNIGDIMFSVYLHSLSDWDLFHVLAGTDIKFEISNEEELEFRIKAVKFLHNSSKLYYSE